MRWKQTNVRLGLLSLALVVLGLALLLVPYSLQVTGALLLLAGAVVLAVAHSRGTLRNALLLALGIGLVSVVTLMSWVLVSGQTDPAAGGAKTAIVLGAQVRGEEPGGILRSRLDAALDYMQENPDCAVILAGGQGGGEDLSEAQAMYNYLVAHGADESRLYRESSSSTTLENLRLSQDLAAREGLDLDGVCLITSEFHLARAEYLAARLGIDAAGYAAESHPWFLKINYALREIPAFVKAWWQTRQAP